MDRMKLSLFATFEGILRDQVEKWIPQILSSEVIGDVEKEKWMDICAM